MITYLPYRDITKIRRTLEPTDKMASGLTAFKILEGKEGPLPETVRMWENDHPMLARYGLVLDVFPSGNVFLEHLSGGPWEPPAWLTNEICESHRGHLKYIGLLRQLCDRINNAFDSVESWCRRNGFPRYWTVEHMEAMHERLDAQSVRRPDCPPAYEHFREPADPQLIWP